MHSPKRKDEYKKIYKVINSETGDPKKIGGLSGTRWLARFSAIDTILSPWNGWKLLFELSNSRKKCLTGQHLYDMMSCPAFKLFLIFLHSNFKLLINSNKLF